MAEKKENLTPEQRLQEALVPCTEWPYKLPENWCWTYLNSVSDVITGGTPSKKIPNFYGGDFPFFKPADLDAGRHVYYANEYLSLSGKKVSRTIPQHSTAVCCIGSIGKCGFLEIEGATNQQINSVIPKINPLYLYYYCSSTEFIKQLWTKASATTISIVNKRKMESCFFPLPPFPEQQCIVDRIESLFSRLDEAKEKAQTVLDSFEPRKAAILHKAFTGEFTAKWRKEHGIRMDSWETKIFDDCVEKMQNGLAKRQGDSGSSIVVLRLANLSDDGFIEDDLRKIILDVKEQQKYILHSNDVLMIRVNGSKDNVAKQFLFNKDVIWAFCDHIIRIKYKSHILSEYMVYFSKTQNYRVYVKDNMVSSAGQNTISRKGIGKLDVPVPGLTEQKEIVRILDSLLAKEQQAKEAAETVLEQIELIKKSILFRAFRGELGTNNPSEPSSKELLKEIIEEER